MSTLSERDRLSKELKLAHQKRMEMSAKATNSESLLMAKCRVFKALQVDDTDSTLHADILYSLGDFELAVKNLAVAQEAVIKLENELLNQ